jgi:excinuclease ABC subunit C
MLGRPEGIPHSSGCYLFSNEENAVIYVGKAKDLAARLANYFAPEYSMTEKTKAMTREATSVEWIVTPSELDALILENELIKLHQPRYNVRLKDDKGYPYVKISTTEPFPVPTIVRKRQGPGRYFGPFADVRSLRVTIDELTSAFPLRSCTRHKFEYHQKIVRPCLLYDIGKCSGPCAKLIDETAYASLVEQWTRFFEGDVTALSGLLEEQMKEDAKALRFEAAASRRDGLSALTKAGARQVVVLDQHTNLDALAVAHSGTRSVVEKLRVRAGRVVGRDYRLIERALDEDDTQLISYCLDDFYRSPGEVPAVVVVGPTVAPELLSEFLSRVRAKNVQVVIAHRGRRAEVLKMAAADASAQLERDSLRRTSDYNVRSQALSQLAVALDMKSSLYRIECFDMSHLQGTNYVGSMVVFEDGLPKKSEYRHFNVKTVPGNNDVAAMAEVLTRRLAYWDEDRGDSKFPRADLIIVDGGLPQLHATEQVILDAGREGTVPLAALAKREELLYVPGSTEPIMLDRGSEALYLVQRLRDEAHRFAITFHRTKRAKAMTLGTLDGIDGLGAKRKDQLLLAFTSLDNLREASLEELRSRGHLPLRVAELVYQRLGGRGLGTSG